MPVRDASEFFETVLELPRWKSGMKISAPREMTANTQTMHKAQAHPRKAVIFDKTILQLIDAIDETLKPGSRGKHPGRILIGIIARPEQNLLVGNFLLPLAQYGLEPS
jgi:hypothetical protein